MTGYQSLLKSIERWERNLEVANDDGIFLLNADSCPLCVEFYGNECEGCPVKNKTGKPYCRDTPYPDVYGLSYDKKKGRLVDQEAVIIATEKELNYLKEIKKDLDYVKQI